MRTDEPDGWVNLALKNGFEPIFGLHVWEHIASIPGVSALDIPKYADHELQQCSVRLAQTAARNSFYTYTELKGMFNRKCRQEQDMGCPSFERFIEMYEPQKCEPEVAT